MTDNKEDDTIYFYRSTDSYGCFCNFSFNKVYYKGHLFRTSEHAFQAQKFEGTPYFFQILNAKSSSEAARLGRSPPEYYKKREDWDQVKDQIMYEICFEKFIQDDHLRYILLDTGNCKIVENSLKDFYWGIGDGTGRNQLGKTLMKIRKEIRKNEK